MYRALFLITVLFVIGLSMCTSPVRALDPRSFLEPVRPRLADNVTAAVDHYLRYCSFRAPAETESCYDAQDGLLSELVLASKVLEDHQSYAVINYCVSSAEETTLAELGKAPTAWTQWFPRPDVGINYLYAVRCVEYLAEPRQRAYLEPLAANRPLTLADIDTVVKGLHTARANDFDASLTGPQTGGAEPTPGSTVANPRAPE